MSDETPRTAGNCHRCGRKITLTKGARQRIYCDDSCKQAAYRWRQRFQDEPALVEQAIDERQARWREYNYSDEMIEQLMTLWYDCGGHALTLTEQLLSTHLYHLVMKYTIEKHNEE